MDKPYVTVQYNDYFPNGESFSAVFFTLQNIDTLMKHYKKTGECADGSYFWASDMIIVHKLTEQTICEAIDNLLAGEEFASVFSKNEESTITSPKDGDRLFKRFNESL